MEIAIVIGLLMLGLFFFILEIFFIPGISIAGITGGLLTVAAVWYAYAHLGAVGGHLTLLGGVLFIGVSLWHFARSKTLDSMSLKTNVEGKVASLDEAEVKVGDRGKTLSRLAPMGKVSINNKTMEAKTADEFIDENVDIVVREVYRTNVLVEKA